MLSVNSVNSSTWSLKLASAKKFFVEWFFGAEVELISVGFLVNAVFFPVGF